MGNKLSVTQEHNLAEATMRTQAIKPTYAVASATEKQDLLNSLCQGFTETFGPPVMNNMLGEDKENPDWAEGKIFKMVNKELGTKKFACIKGGVATFKELGDGNLDKRGVPAIFPKDAPEVPELTVAAPLRV